MPKSKSKAAVESDSGSSSDSGPEDRNPPPSKKAKPGGRSGEASKRGVENEDGEISWELDKNRFVKVRDFKGKTYVDIREYYMNAEGKLMPGKKGISLNTMQWQKFKGLIDDIDEAVKSK